MATDEQSNDPRDEAKRQEQAKRYYADAVDVYFNPTRCIHAAECVRGLPDVFDTAKRPWIQPDNGDPEAIARVVERCPTGALHYERRDGGSAERPDPTVSIAVVDGGPHYVRGDIRVEDADGNEIVRDTRVALCRCGKTQTPPFCDYSHHDLDAEELAYEIDSEKAVDEEPVAQVTIRATANGPYYIKECVALKAGETGAASPQAKVALCRCGASNDKPYCDGSHAVIGFEV